MSKTWKRILLFFIGVPALICIILFLPFKNHLAINIVACVICVLGAYEFNAFFQGRGSGGGNSIVPLLAGLLPVAAYLETVQILPSQATIVTLVLLMLLIMSVRALSEKGDDYSSVLTDIAASFAVLAYPSLFLIYFIKLSAFSNATYVILTFLIIVFANDTGAYFFGSIIGGRSRGVTRISPSKSLAGFIAGLICSIGFSLLCNAVFPGVYGYTRPWLVSAVVGTVVGIVTILGDLVESAFKRSVGIKDSGTVIPGRGGVLDSVDSILFAAPVFFYLLTLTL